MSLPARVHCTAIGSHSKRPMDAGAAVAPGAAGAAGADGAAGAAGEAGAAAAAGAARHRSRSPRNVVNDRLHVRNVSILRGGMVSLRATLNVVNERVDDLERFARVLSSAAGREPLPPQYGHNIDLAVQQAVETGHLLRAMSDSFEHVVDLF